MFSLFLVWVRSGRLRGGGACRSFGMGAVVGGCASRDICLNVLGFAVRLGCPILVGVDVASCLLWAGKSPNQNLNSNCVVCMKKSMLCLSTHD